MNHTAASVPRIAGHHFSDVLGCPHRAWLGFHGDGTQKSEFPSQVLIRLNDGRVHEQDVYNTLYPDSVEIPSNLSASDRSTRTAEAMIQGVPHIRQGYIATENGVGVIDLLERVEADQYSSTGNSYRVGEIKHSQDVRTEHVFQVAWYNQLLESVYGQKRSDGFVILADSRPIIIDLVPIANDFRAALSRLHQLRASESPPGPHLIPQCASCPWRAVCMPEIVSQHHLSLVPALDRRLAASLHNAGIHTWKDLLSIEDSVLASHGADPETVLRIRSGLDRLQKNAPPLKHPILLDELRRSPIVTFDHIPASGGHFQPPTTMYLERDGVHTTYPLSWQDNVISNSEIPGFNTQTTLLVYGDRDATVLKRILRQLGIAKRVSVRDMLDIIDAYLHVPLVDRDLSSLSEYLGTPHSNDGAFTPSTRLTTISALRDWITAT